MFELIDVLGEWAWILLILLGGVGVYIVVYIKRKQKQIDLTEISIGPATVTITDIPVNRIVFLTQPQDATGRPALLNDIKIKVYDENNKPLNRKKVTLELDLYSGTDYLRGILEKTSDNTGTVVFSSLKISRAGQYTLVAKSEDKFMQSVSFEIMPPGLDTNFSDKAFNSPEYKEALARKLVLSKGGDELKMDEEEI